MNETKTHFIVIGVSESKSLFEPGEKFFLCNAEWVDATACPISWCKEGFPKDTKTFKTRQAAENFIKRWNPHPWNIQPRADEWVVLEVTPKFTQVLSGYEPVKEGVIQE